MYAGVGVSDGSAETVQTGRQVSVTEQMHSPMCDRYLYICYSSRMYSFPMQKSKTFTVLQMIPPIILFTHSNFRSWHNAQQTMESWTGRGEQGYGF